MKKSLLVLVVAVVLSGAATSLPAAPVIFSSGFTLPETISQVPQGFGDLGGQYFVPDPGAINADQATNTIWAVPANGGPPTVFATITAPAGFSTLGGLFLPGSFGVLGGQYIVGANTAFIALSPTDHTILTPTSPTGFTAMTTPAIAPAGFGTGGGDLFFTAQFGPTGPNFDGGILEVTPSLNLGVFATTTGVHPFGLAFAPQHFGTVGGDMLVSSTIGNQILALDGNGTQTVFATIPGVAADAGLRQIGFAPSNFGAFSGDLLVSVAAGALTHGELYAVNSAGQVVGELKTGNAPFDPRGFTFTASGQILISDASDPILLATPADFGPAVGVPEISTGALPSVLAIFGGGILVMTDRRRRRTAA